MKLRAPTYYKNFKCIAERCKNNCCKAGWEIDIDDETAKLYKSVSNDFGKKLNDNIEYTKPAHFILDKSGICPFLNNKNLCEIYINLGEKNMCQICQDHPRYYEWFNGLKECGVGLCCEEAARIILTNTSPFSTYETEIPTEECDSYDEELYSYLLNARSKIINHLDNDNIPFGNRIQNILWYAYTLQQNIDNNLLDDEEIINVKINKKNNINSILNYFLSLDFNTNNFYNYLKNNLIFCDTYFNNFNFKNNIFLNNFSDKKNIFSNNLLINNYLKNISIYFIWRYFLKGIFDYDVLSKIKLTALSISILNFLFYCEIEQNGDLNLDKIIDIVRQYSEEIEYSEDNLQNLAEASYELDIFSTEKIMELFF